VNASLVNTEFSGIVLRYNILHITRHAIVHLEHVIRVPGTASWATAKLIFALVPLI
jgi:hypothetical protein